MISAVNLQRKFILILMFLGGQFSGGKVVSFQAEKTNGLQSSVGAKFPGKLLCNGPGKD
jgi:hypothetical protein